MNLYLKLIVISVLTLCGCTSTPRPSAQSATKPERYMLAEIRAAGRAVLSAVEVQPLRDPAVEGFVKQAEMLENQGKPGAALAEIEHAQKLAPEAPELLQYRAELEIMLGRYADAEAHARRSFELGPKIGSLCARNWQTLFELRYLARDMASVDSAASQRDQCKASGPARM